MPASDGFMNRNFSRIALDNCEIHINSGRYAWYGKSDWNSVNPTYNNCYCYSGKFLNGSAVASSGGTILNSLTIRRCVYVNSVELSVASPVVGEPLPTTASVINSSNNPYNIQVKNVFWNRVYSGSSFPLDEGYVCKLGETYSVSFGLYLNGQDVFFRNVTATVNGKAAPADAYTGLDLSVYYIFPQLANTYYNVWVGGMQVNDINKSDVLGDGGSVKYSETWGGHRLTLENANITNTGNPDYEFTGYGRGVYSNLSGLTIRVIGNNTIDSKGEGIYFTGNLSILGSSDNQGKLSVKGSYGIRPAKSSTSTTMTIGGVELTAEGTSGAGIGASTSFSSSSSYNCTMKVGIANTVVKAKGTSVSLGNLYDLVFEDGLDIVQPTGASFNGEDVIDANGNIIKGSWVIIKGESGISTGVALPLNDNGEMINDKAGSWYTLDGRKLNGQPTKKGVYIHNGKTVIR